MNSQVESKNHLPMALEKHPSWFASSKVDNHHKTSIGNVTFHVCFDILGIILLRKTNS
jgi:hypothetical protein